MSVYSQLKNRTAQRVSEGLERLGLGFLETVSLINIEGGSQYHELSMSTQLSYVDFTFSPFPLESASYQVTLKILPGDSDEMIDLKLSQLREDLIVQYERAAQDLVETKERILQTLKDCGV